MKTYTATMHISQEMTALSKVAAIKSVCYVLNIGLKESKPVVEGPGRRTVVVNADQLVRSYLTKVTVRGRWTLPEPGDDGHNQDIPVGDYIWFDEVTELPAAANYANEG